MIEYVLAILFLGLLCGAWVVVQRVCGELTPETHDRSRLGCGSCAQQEQGCEDADLHVSK